MCRDHTPPAKPPYVRYTTDDLSQKDYFVHCAQESSSLNICCLGLAKSCQVMDLSFSDYRQPVKCRGIEDMHDGPQ
jgi:hypothetical protein